jgi:LysM repeat protein
MDYDNYDPMSPRDSDYLTELLDDDSSRRSRRQRRTAKSGRRDSGGDSLSRFLESATGLSPLHLGVVVFINAVVALVISLGVVFLVGRPEPRIAEDVEGGTVASTMSSGTAAISVTVVAVDVVGTEATDVLSQSAAEETSLAPTATPVPAAPTQPPTAYIVRPGDTLISIAEQFGVNPEDLMRVNGLDNPDLLLLGQELMLPLADAPEAAAETADLMSTVSSGDAPIEMAPAAPSPTSVPTPTPVPAGEIRLIMDVLNPGDVTRETVYLANNGLYVKLTGWTLVDEQGNTYTFPDFGLGGGGAAVNLHTAAGEDTITDLFWNRPMAVWDVGEEATLLDATGTEVLSVGVRPQSAQP